MLILLSLANRNPRVKPEDELKKEHPNYRNFFVNPEPPLETPMKTTLESNYKDLS
ncbi:unnamed protein product [marine sediment metagenome]|uniref:Uncharacterized protein n=1 Tax=marine sediment metagenome TaxID=412755 RepID=X1TFY9_9ZZZZ